MKLNDYINLHSAYMTYPATKPLFQKNGIAFIDNVKEIPEIKFPARFDIAIFALALKGEARLSINLKEYTIKPNGLILIAPNSIILKQEKSEDFAAIYIAVSSELMNSMSVGMPGQLNVFLYIQEHPVTLLKEEEVTLLKDYYSFVRKQIQLENKTYIREITYHLVSSLFYEILNIIDRYQPDVQISQSRQKELFERFLHLLKENYKVNRSVTFYADKLCITPKYLSALSKGLTQLTASEWIDRCVILEAKGLLKGSSKTIQEISDELNFPNQSFFGKYFKNHTGLSPKDFRNS